MTNEPEPQTTPPPCPTLTARHAWTAIATVVVAWLSMLCVSRTWRILASSSSSPTATHTAGLSPNQPGFLLFMVFCTLIGAFAHVCVPVSLAHHDRIPVRGAFRLRRVRGMVYLLTIVGALSAGGIGNNLVGLLSRVIPSLGSGTRDIFGVASGGVTAASAIGIALAMLTAAVYEELLMRGFVQQGFENSYGTVPAILLTAVIFALLHGQPVRMISVAPGGLFLCLVAWWTDSVYPTMAAHLAMNGLATAFLIALSLSGASPKQYGMGEGSWRGLIGFVGVFLLCLMCLWRITGRERGGDSEPCWGTVALPGADVPNERSTGDD